MKHVYSKAIVKARAGLFIRLNRITYINGLFVLEEIIRETREMIKGKNHGTKPYIAKASVSDRVIISSSSSIVFSKLFFIENGF